jgi:hypothetical protein
MSTNQMESELLLHTYCCWLGPTYWGRDGILQSIGAGVEGMVLCGWSDSYRVHGEESPELKSLGHKVIDLGGGHLFRTG